jgi:hypothetical protein
MTTLLADPVVRLVLLTRLVLLAGAPVTLFLVTALRSAEEQGFYFVFANVQAIAVLFEYVIGAMLVQFASHASAANGRHDVFTEERVRGTLTAARRWFNVSAFLVVAVILPGGFALFRGEADRGGVPFSAAWITLTLTLGAYLTIVPSICVLEGSGQLRRVQRMRLTQASVTTLFLWILIPVVGSLSAVAIASVVNLVVAGGWLALWFPWYLSPFPSGQPSRAADAQMSSAQSRAAMSGAVGFLGPQLISPIVFHYQGAVAAGQMGLSLAAANAPLMLAVSWLQARYPEYGSLVARNELGGLDKTARRTTVQSVLAWCVSTAALFALVVSLQRFFPGIGSRFLPPASVAALAAASLAYLLFQAMAGRLRAHREESLLWPMMFGTLASILATIAGARWSAATAAFSHSLAVLLVLLPLSIATFLRRRRALYVRHPTPVGRSDP